MILFCSCAHSKTFASRDRDQIRAVLQHCEERVTEIPDMCRLVAEADPTLKAYADSAHLTIIACYPRAVRALFAAAGYPLGETRTTFLNIHEQSPGDIARSLNVDPAVAKEEASPETAAFGQEKEADWIPWFPVIDRERCRDCGQCLDFCLFGVYEKDADGRIRVKNPHNCKTECPACARICPYVAIMFPKIDEASPVNGAATAPEKAPRGTVNLNVDELFGDDVYAKLKNRRKTRLLKRKGVDQ